MGTSKSYPTPSGGDWTPLKKDITDKIAGNQSISAAQIVGGTVRALGGLRSSGGSSSGGASGGGGSGGRGRGGKGRGGSIGGTVSGLGGFGQAVQSGGLDSALEKLGLSELKDRPASEVIARIAEHLCEAEEGLQQEVMVDALKDALLEAATLQEGGEYKDLEAALQNFFERNGVEALIEGFLSNYVFDKVWMAIENHAQLRAEIAKTSEALSVAVGQACREHVGSLVGETRVAGTFGNIDWFGREGIRLANELVTELETRLRAL
jgi:hypothetical protein